MLKQFANFLVLMLLFAAGLAHGRIFDNIRKFTNYLPSTSLGEVAVVLALSIAGYFRSQRRCCCGSMS